MTPTILIYRHRRENRAKCTLTPLESRTDFRFLTYPKDPLPDLSSYLVLRVGAPLLTPTDKDKGLLLIDGTWSLASIMDRACPTTIEARSLPPHFSTAYPRRQTGCPDPDKGLASIEALYLACLILERPTEGLLDHYYWKDEFLKINHLS
jgi:pre-rRNA-processing protein TSR3